MWKLLGWFLRPNYVERREQEHEAHRERNNSGPIVVLGLLFGGPLVFIAAWVVSGNGYIATAMAFLLIVVVPAVVSNAAAKAVGSFGPLHSQRAGRYALFLVYALLILGALGVLKLADAGAISPPSQPVTSDGRP